MSQIAKSTGATSQVRLGGTGGECLGALPSAARIPAVLATTPRRHRCDSTSPAVCPFQFLCSQRPSALEIWSVESTLGALWSTIGRLWGASGGENMPVAGRASGPAAGGSSWGGLEETTSENHFFPSWPIRPITRFGTQVVRGSRFLSIQLASADAQRRQRTQKRRRARARFRDPNWRKGGHKALHKRSRATASGQSAASYMLRPRVWLWGGVGHNSF